MSSTPVFISWQSDLPVPRYVRVPFQLSYSGEKMTVILIDHVFKSGCLAASENDIAKKSIPLQERMMPLPFALGKKTSILLVGNIR
jgi:hypothetical protein